MHISCECIDNFSNLEDDWSAASQNCLDLEKVLFSCMIYFQFQRFFDFETSTWWFVVLEAAWDETTENQQAQSENLQQIPLNIDVSVSDRWGCPNWNNIASQIGVIIFSPPFCSEMFVFSPYMLVACFD